MLRDRRRAWSEFFAESGYVAQVYLDSLRDNFVGYIPTDLIRYEEVKVEFDAMARHDAPEPYLADLLRIELALIDLMPDDVVEARFWAVDDRFRRVVPLATRDRYDRSVAPRGDQCWREAGFIRNQTHTLLHVIHSNYLLNIGREQSIKRLKVIMWLFGATLLLVGLAAAEIQTSDAKSGLLLLMACGVFGSLLSITNRMQAAVAVDAMTQDGIYELTGLRVGWVGILMSLLLGGGFALVLYLVVMAGVLDLATPRPEVPVNSANSGVAGGAPGNVSGGAGSGSRPPTSLASARHSASDPAGPSCLPVGSVAAACPTSGDAAQTVSNLPVPPATTNVDRSHTSAPTARLAQSALSPVGPKRLPAGTGGTQAGAARQTGGATTSPSETDSATDTSTRLSPAACSQTGGCPFWAARIGRRLGFPTAEDLFKMMVLAFLAGFAERFVPDILNRLSKQQEK